MDQAMTFEEQEIMRNAYVFLKNHCNPPANQDENACNWWMQAAQEMGQVCGAWNNHPLATEVFLALYNYIEGKAKKKTEEHDNVQEQ